MRSSTWRYHHRFACSYVYHVERFHRNAEEPMLYGSGDLEAGDQCLEWYPDDMKRTSSHAGLISKFSAIVTYCSRYLLHPCWKVQMKGVSTMYTFYHDAIVSFYRVCATARQEHHFDSLSALEHIREMINDSILAYVAVSHKVRATGSQYRSTRQQIDNPYRSRYSCKEITTRNNWP